MVIIRRDYVPEREAEFQIWLNNFITVANANLAQTGLTAGQMTELNDLSTDYSVLFGSHLSAWNVAKSLTPPKNAALEAVISKVRELAQIVQKHPGASAQLKTELQITVPGPVPAPPVIPEAPSSLNATLNSLGYVTLKWDKNGNKPGTSYILEFREGTSGPFQFLASVTKSKYVDTGRAAGVEGQYRVHAVRASGSSGYSPLATIYGPGWQTPSLQIAA